MKKVRPIVTLILIICTCMGTISAEVSTGEPYSGISASDTGGETITIVDDCGQYITIPYPVRHVVFLVENAMNSMYAVGGAEKISGIGSIWMPEKKEPFYRAIDPFFDEKPKFTTDSGEIDLDTLANAHPDLVVLWTADWNDQTSSDIRTKLHIPVYGAYYTKLSDVSRANSIYAKILGNEAREAEVSGIMGEYTRKVTGKTAGLPESDRPSVFWMWNDMFGTAGLNSATNDLLRLAGGKNAIEEADFEGKMLEHPVVPFDTLQNLNPDVIYLWYNEEIDPSDIIDGSGDFAAWKNLDAVKNGRVYEVTDPFIYDSFSPQQPLALMGIAQNLHPELFRDVNQDENTDSFFVKMYGVHYPGFSPA